MYHIHTHLLDSVEGHVGPTSILNGFSSLNIQHTVGVETVRGAVRLQKHAWLRLMYTLLAEDKGDVWVDISLSFTSFLSLSPTMQCSLFHVLSSH